ncbi:Hypothetical predicted protein, partial [Scomber scombrus]
NIVDIMFGLQGLQGLLRVGSFISSDTRPPVQRTSPPALRTEATVLFNALFTESSPEPRRANGPHTSSFN